MGGIYIFLSPGVQDIPLQKVKVGGESSLTEMTELMIEDDLMINDFALRTTQRVLLTNVPDESGIWSRSLVVSPPRPSGAHAPPGLRCW